MNSDNIKVDAKLNLKSLGEKQYLTKVANLFEALHGKAPMAKRKKEFFVVTLMGLRRGYKDPSSEDFTRFYQKEYLNHLDQNSKQTRSMICTLRKKLVKEGILQYDKNKMEVSVNFNWHLNDSLDLLISLGA